MASIWFGDLGDRIIIVPDNIKEDNAKKILEDIYNEWEIKHSDIFKNFKPVKMGDNGKLVCDDMVGFDDNQYFLTFVSQGTNNHNISWGSFKYEMGNNEIIKSFTNDLLKRLGKSSELIFSFQVITDGCWEDCYINIFPNFNDRFPNVKADSDFYNDYGDCEKCGIELDEDNEKNICGECIKENLSKC